MDLSPLKRTVISCALTLIAAPATANMSNMPSTYGLLPGDIASAQATSLFSNQVSTLFYNPAALARDSRGELTFGFLHADHDLKAESRGGASPITRSSDTIQDTPAQDVLIGMKTNLSSLTDYNHPIYFAFMAGVEKYGKELMAFKSETSDEGQYLNYGRQPLFLSLGGATTLWRGIDVGASVRVTLQSEAQLIAETDLAGNTQYEKLNVSAKPVIRPILGTNINWGKTFCENDCWLSNLETAISWRAFSNTRTTVNANTVIPGTIPAPGLTLAIRTLDSFQPETVSAGIRYNFGKTRLAVGAEYQAWSRLESELRKDTIKDTSGANFQDIVIPRIGLEYDLSETLMFTTGLAWEPTPLESRRSLDVNYLDADRIIFGFGIAANIKKIPVLSQPVRLDLGYQFHHLDSREFDLTTSRPGVPSPYETVNARGDVHVFAGSVTLKF